MEQLAALATIDVKWLMEQFMSMGQTLAILVVFGRLMYKYAKESMAIKDLQDDMNAMFEKQRQTQRLLNTVNETLKETIELVEQMKKDAEDDIPNAS